MNKKTMNKNFDISDHLSMAAMLEQTAEEASELAQASSKLARLYRGENPVRKTESECICDLTEEFADVLLCLRYLAENYKVVQYMNIDSVRLSKQDRLEKTLKNKGE